MTNYRPFLLCLACLGLAALVWLDNRETIMSMLVSHEPIASQDTPKIEKMGKTASLEDNADEPKQSSETGLLIGNPLAEFDKSQLENWVQRPLFAPSRKRPPPQEAKKASDPRPTPPDYQLLGVLLNAKSAIAVLRRENTGAGVRVQVGDMIGGWLVASVERESVTLKRDQEEPQIIRFKKACSKSAGSSCP